MATQKSCELLLATSWKLAGNPGCQPGLATSFQPVRVVGCVRHCSELVTVGLWHTGTGCGNSDCVCFDAEQTLTSLQFC